MAVGLILGGMFLPMLVSLTQGGINYHTPQGTLTYVSIGLGLFIGFTFRQLAHSWMSMIKD
jgi:hypothetical protein